MTLRCAVRNKRSNKTGKKSIYLSDLKDTKPDSDMQRISYYDSVYNDFTNDYDTLTEPFSYTSLIRNNQHIAGISPFGFKHSSSRASSDASLKICGVRSELLYETNSYQTNHIDNELGIQLNKNQHSHQVPKQLEKLISWCRTKCHDDLKKILKPPPPPPPQDPHPLPPPQDPHPLPPPQDPHPLPPPEPPRLVLYIKGPLDISYKNIMIEYINKYFDPNDADIISFINRKKLYKSI
jgi:hypothetical protein